MAESSCTYWSGTAPFCDGHCPDACTVLQVSSSGGGATCSTGSKMLCDCCTVTTTLSLTTTTTKTLLPTTTTTTATYRPTATAITASYVFLLLWTSDSTTSHLPANVKFIVSTTIGGAIGVLAIVAMILVIRLYCTRKKRASARMTMASAHDSPK